MELKSVFDGWTKQCFFVAADLSGAYCARGFLYEAQNRFSGQFLDRETSDPDEVRIGRYIQKHFKLPEFHEHERSGYILKPRQFAHHAIVYANNNLKLTPDDFRRIDRLTAIAEGMAAVERLVQSVEVADGITA